jgi:hypothetical protein
MTLHRALHTSIPHSRMPIPLQSTGHKKPQLSTPVCAIPCRLCASIATVPCAGLSTLPVAILPMPLPSCTARYEGYPLACPPPPHTHTASNPQPQLVLPCFTCLSIPQTLLPARACPPPPPRKPRPHSHLGICPCIAPGTFGRCCSSCCRGC